VRFPRRVLAARVTIGGHTTSGPLEEASMAGHDQRYRAARVLAAGLATLMALAACRAEPTDTDRPAPPVQAPAPEAGSAAADQLAILRKPGTLVSLTCTRRGGDALRLTGLSADSGAVIADLTITFPPNTRPGGGINPCLPIQFPNRAKPRWRQLFSPDYGRVAVEIAVPATRARHVGYVDVRTNELRDLTGPPDDDSRFGSAAQDERPLFDATGDRLWFTSRSHEGDRRLASTDVATGDRKEHGAVPSADLLPLTGGRVLVGDEVDVDVDVAVPNPGGSAVLTTGLATPVSAQEPIARFRTTPLHQLAGGDPLVSRGQVSSDPETCTPLGWVDDRTGLCAMDDDELRLLTFSPDFTAIERVGDPLLPATDRENTDAVLSPDRTAIAFLSQQGRTLSLYTLRLDGRSDPRRVADLTERPMLIAWS
jgi:hypothetical protein